MTDKLKAARIAPRPSDDDLADLKESIKRHGQLQPILARADTGEVLVGERRRKAISALRLDPDVLYVDVDDAEAVTLRISDEVAARGLDSMTMAHAIGKVREQFLEDGKSGKGRFASPNQKTAELLGITVERVKYAVSLAGLPEEVQKQVEGKPKSSGGRPPDDKDSKSKGTKDTKAKDSGPTISVRIAEDIAHSGLTKAQQIVVADKVARGILPGTRDAFRAALKYAKEARPEVARIILKDKEGTLQDARRAEDRFKADEGRKRRDEAKALPEDIWADGVARKVTAWAIGLTQMQSLVGSISESRRPKVLKAMTKLRDVADSWIGLLAGEPGIPATATKVRKVLQQVGDDWREVAVMVEESEK